MKVSCVLLPFISLVLETSGDAETVAGQSTQHLEAEHRSNAGRAADPESFLDRIASLFPGGAPPPSGPPPGHKLQQAGSKLPPQRLGPVYRPGPGPAPHHPQASVQRPVAVRPPPTYPKKQFQQVNRLAGGASNVNTVQHKAPARSSNTNPADPWQIAQPANMAQIKDLQVQCEKDLMRVRVVFDRPFYGMVFSKGFYSNINCVHVPSGLGQTQATFDIAMGQCGMTTGGNSDTYGTPTPQGSYIENTIIVQYDPLLQEVWDQARKIRCTWYDFYEKAVTFKPYQVDMLDPVTANFLGDNLRCWMQIQVGKGPYASEVSGIVKIGQTMTMVLGVKDDENKFDMMVRNCVAHDGQRAPIQLVDEKGCVVREKIMSPFKKVKNFDSTANVLSYAYFQAFKFPDSMNVHFQCVVQVCRSSCPDPQCGGPAPRPNDVDSYGSPQSSPVGLDSYGSPAAPASSINPRLPGGGQSQYQPGSQRRVSVVRPESGPRPQPIPLNADTIQIPRPGYSDFNKRMGVDTNTLGGKPRSLEFSEGEEVEAVEEDPDMSLVEGDRKGRKINLESGNSVEEETERRKRSADVSARDANGNRILTVYRRVKRDAETEDTEEEIDETEDDVEQADIETQESVIRVVSPTDVQFQLDTDDKEEVVINMTSPEALCIDTAAFVGVTISFLMLLVIAFITIIFLWLRIRAIDRKNLL